MIRELIKTGASFGVSMVFRQARYDRVLLVISHMRSASTAFCNVLCSHPEISGYGETHVSHGKARAPGRLIVNLMRRRAFDPGSHYVLDKVLHNHLLDHQSGAFRRARAIFLLREPEPTIASIVNLSRQVGMQDTMSGSQAAAYYKSRVEQLIALWQRFPPDRRIGIRTEHIFASPDDAVARVGQWLGLSRPLANSYVPNPASSKTGGGDPLFSAGACRIEKRGVTAKATRVSNLSPVDVNACQIAHGELLAQFQLKRG